MKKESWKCWRQTRVRLTSYLGTAIVQTLDGKVSKSSDDENGKEEGMKKSYLCYRININSLNI